MFAFEPPVATGTRRLDAAKRPLRLALAAFACLWLLAGCSLFADKTTTGGAQPLPDVTGLDIDEAVELLAARGYLVDTVPLDRAQVTELLGDDITLWPTDGRVLVQAPVGGAATETGGRVVLQFCDFETTIVDPGDDDEIELRSVAGLDLAAATQLLRAQGFGVQSSTLDAAAMRALFGERVAQWPRPGQVVVQSPAAGAQVAQDSTIELGVAQWSFSSAGLNGLVGKSATVARRELEALGFEVTVNEVASSAAAGTVLSAAFNTSDVGAHTAVLNVAQAPAAVVVAPPDADRDRVSDALDQCPQTPAGARVDAKGCELDDDRDGVVNRLDRCAGAASGQLVDGNGCGIVASPGDDDRDGVANPSDRCPDTPASAVDVDVFGCTLEQKVDKLPTGLYAFNRYTDMLVDGKTTYDLVLILDPTDARSPETIEQDVLNALPPNAIASHAPPSPPTDNPCTEPVRCVEAKYHDKMVVELGVDQPSWVIDAEPASKGQRIVLSSEKTVWRWTVLPACEPVRWLSRQCKKATLRLSAKVILNDAAFETFQILDESISVDVTLGVFASSFLSRHFKWLLLALLLPFIVFVVWWLKRRGSAPAAPEFEPVSVLFIGANPRSTSRIRLDEEVRGIDQSIRLGDRRDAFTLHQHWAARVTDLDDALMRYKPNIVHISAHGTPSGELLMEGGEGEDGKVSAEQLERLFAILSDDIRLVVLNACFSKEQAQRIVNHVDCVIGMSAAVNDAVATRFSESLYLALANGRSVQTAFDLASAESLAGRENEEAVPRLLALRTSPARVEFARRAPSTTFEEVTG